MIVLLPFISFHCLAERPKAHRVRGIQRDGRAGLLAVAHRLLSRMMMARR